MTSNTALIDGKAVRSAFRQWHDEQEPLDGQLSESLAALSAYQSHLDTWQQQLACEREELRAATEQFERDRAAAEHTADESLAQLTTELTAAREKISALTAALSARTEELRNSDSLRVESVTELELVRTREKELRETLEEAKRAHEQERAHWTEELRHLHELLEQRASESKPAHQPPPAEPAPKVQAPPVRPVEHVQPKPANYEGADGGAVFGSILQQFGKLRQQRAQERPAPKKAR